MRHQKTGLVTERQRIQHLLRRAAFGYSSAELEEYLALGLDGTIERLLAPELVDDTTAEVAGGGTVAVAFARAIPDQDPRSQ